MKIVYENNTLYFYENEELSYVENIDDMFDEDELFDLANIIANGNEDLFYQIIDEVLELLGWND